MLWENWRLTRNESAQRLVQGFLLSGAALAWFAGFGRAGNDSARFALFLLGMTYMPMWISVARLNGGRFMDGYRPGYPFYFLYTRPVRTFVLVGAPMAYNVGLTVALYIVSALVLRQAFGSPFPVLPLAAMLAAFHVAQWAAQWGTSSKAVQWCGSIVAAMGFTGLAMWRGREWPARFDFSIGDYTLMAAVAAACFSLTVAGVARQRRGDALAFNPRTVTRSGFLDWLAGLFPSTCPTASATRAQIWFELKSSGLPVLAIGGALAIVIPLLVVIGVQIDVVLSRFYHRPAGLAGPASLAAAMVVALFSPSTVLLLGGNAFGIRTRQGRTHASVFDATQACGTARIACLKVLVRSVCVLAALVAVGVSVWAAMSFIAVSDSGAPLQRYEPVRSWQRALEGPIGAMSASQLLALAFIISAGVAIMVAVRAALPALRTRYPRLLKIAGWTLLLDGVVLVLLSLGARRGIVAEVVAVAIFKASRWGVAAAIGLAALYVVWRTFAERLLTLRATLVVVLISAAFATAWVTVLRATGMPLADMPTLDALAMLSPAALPLMASVLAPWSLSCARHT
jgi:hypothetical protein